jgi:hypothetical protein
MHEYLRRLKKALDAGTIQPGDVALASVAHDSWCSIHRGRECNCDPEITLETARGRIELQSDGTMKTRGEA